MADKEPIFVNQIFIKGIFPLHIFFFPPLPIFWSSPDWQLFVVSFFFFLIPSFVKFQTKYSLNQFYTINIRKPNNLFLFQKQGGRYALFQHDGSHFR